MVKIFQQRSSSLSNFHSRNAHSPIFARRFSFDWKLRKTTRILRVASANLEPCNPETPALRKWWHTILERFRVFCCFWELDLWFSVPVRHSKSNLLSTTTLSTLSVTAKRNWPFPSSKNSHFRNKAKCKTFLVKMKFICMRIKNHSHINGFTLSLALKQRLEATWKWPIEDKNLKIVKITCFSNLVAKAWQFLRLLLN